MSNAPRRTRLSWLAAIALLTLSQAGCQAVLLFGYLIGGPPMIEPDFNKQTSEKLDGKNKTVLVMCYAPTELRWDNDAVDYELSKFVAHRLNANSIKVMDPDRVHAWLDKNKDWSKISEVGAEFQVDYIVHIDLKEYSLFEEHTHELYRGRSDAVVSVIKMNEDKKDGDSIYSKELKSRFPKTMGVSVYQYSYADFKQLYLATLADEVGMLFYPYAAGEDIPRTALQ
ncbi:MAG: hypothetical protein ACKV0T_20565 [Planctomycetales bacterium]